MSLIRKIGIAMGTVACMAVTIVGISFGGEKFVNMGKRSVEKKYYAAAQLKHAGEAKHKAETG